jgi:hypothetical protein
MLRRRTASASFFISATSFTKSSGTRRIDPKLCTIAACGILFAFAHGEKVRDFYIPTTLDDYRAYLN